MIKRGFDRLIEFVKDNRWTPLTIIAVGLMLYSIGRNTIPAIDRYREIIALESERDRHQELITRDSTLLEDITSNSGLERIAREKHRMQRHNEEVFIFE